MGGVRVTLHLGKDRPASQTFRRTLLSGCASHPIKWRALVCGGVLTRLVRGRDVAIYTSAHFQRLKGRLAVLPWAPRTKTIKGGHIGPPSILH